MRTMIRALLALALACVVPWSASAEQAGISPCASESLSVSNTSSNVQLSACGPVVIVYNISSQEAFYNYGTASNTAATTSNYSLPGNTYITLNLNGAGGYLAAITSTSTTTFRIIQGYAAP